MKAKLTWRGRLYARLLSAPPESILHRVGMWHLSRRVGKMLDEDLARRGIPKKAATKDET